MAATGQSIDCHKIVVASLSPWMRTLLAGDSDQVILPDFGLAEECGLVNFYYRGR